MSRMISFVLLLSAKISFSIVALFVFFVLLIYSSNNLLLVGQVVTVNQTTSPSLTDCRVANVAGNKIGYINSSDQESKGGHVFATYQSNSKDFHKLQIAIASRKHILSQTALKVLMKRRNELVTASSSSYFFFDYLFVILI